MNSLWVSIAFSCRINCLWSSVNFYTFVILPPSFLCLLWPVVTHDSHASRIQILLHESSPSSCSSFIPWTKYESVSKNDLFANITSCFHSYLLPFISVCDVLRSAGGRLACGSDQCKQRRCKEDFGQRWTFAHSPLIIRYNPCKLSNHVFHIQRFLFLWLFFISPLSKTSKIASQLLLGWEEETFSDTRVYIALLVKCQRDRQTCNGALHRV